MSNSQKSYTTGLTFEKVRSMIADFYSSVEYAELKQRLATIPFMETIGKSRNETAHSSFISWFFNEEGLKHISISPIIAFLRLLAEKSECSIQMSEELRHEILTNTVIVKSITANTEQATQSNKGNGRADIVLMLQYQIYNSTADKRLRIVIENKIDSPEGKNQCAKYYDHYSKLNDVESTMYVYLSPWRVDKVSDRHFIIITYQDLLLRIFEPIVKISRQLPVVISSHINEFVESITSMRTSNRRRTKSYPIIAMDSKLKKLLTDFYNNNQELILAAIKAGAPDEISQGMEEGQRRNYSSYEIEYSVNDRNKTVFVDSKSKLAKVFVEAYCDIYPATTLPQMNEVLKKVKENLISSVNGDRTYEITGREWYIPSGIWGDKSNYFKNLKKVIVDSGMKLTEITT